MRRFGQVICGAVAGLGVLIMAIALWIPASEYTGYIFAIGVIAAGIGSVCGMLVSA